MHSSGVIRSLCMHTAQGGKRYTLHDMYIYVYALKSDDKRLAQALGKGYARLYAFDRLLLLLC